ncbi:MAG: efflux RND transporter permease subunit [bacterium]|nr:efflux RND transporter permease subunit [Planctomycetota bacterium]HIL51961.1 efflux RND transporter permease subunit [Planctomycetota bacterium]
MISPKSSGFLGASVGRPVTLLVTLAALLVIGVIAYQRIPLEMMPAGIQNNGLQIFISHPGSSAEENEAKVVRVIEERIRTLSGIDDIYSSSREDGASMEIIYDRGVDMKLAKAELRDSLERARALLPDSVDRVLVWSWDNSALPLMWLAVLHSENTERADYLVDTIVQRKIESVDGVSKVEIFGMLDDSVRVLLDEESIKAASLDIGALIRRLSSDNFAKPLGEVQDGGQRILLRSDMRFKTVEEVAAYPIGRGLTIADVGRVKKVKTVRDRLSRIDGRFAYFGQIGKESNANVVETARRVEAMLEELEADPRIGGELDFLVLFSQSDFIEASLDQLRSTALWGGTLAALVLLVFLRRVRVTLCVALSIPISSLLSLTWVYFSGGTFNILTMTGITLAIGMLVDNAVVVIENIARLGSLGRTPREAAVEGVRDVGLAIFLATLTTVVVFLPMIFMTSNPVVRIMFGALGLPFCVSLLFSLVVALVFLPAVAARIIGPRAAWVESIAKQLAIPAQIPVRLVQSLLALGARAARILATVLHRLERLLLAVLVPARWLLALALLGFAIRKAVLFRAETREFQALFGPGMLPQSAAQGVELTAWVWVISGVLGALLLFFGVKSWSRRPRQFGRQPIASPRPRSASFIDLAVQSNRSLLSWSMQHRLLASFLAGLAFLSVLIPSSNLTITSFGEDENRGRIDVRVGLEDNFTLGEASSELARYERVLDEHKAELGFKHVSTRFDSRGGQFSIYWDESQSPERMKQIRRQLKNIWPKLAGHEVAFYGEENIDTRNKSIVNFQVLGPDSEVLAKLGEKALDKLKGVPGLSGLSSPLQDAPQQVHVRMDVEQSWQMGVTADIALQNIAWALRGFQLPRFHEPGRELPFIIEYDEEEVAGLHTLRDLGIYTETGAVALASFARFEFRPGPRVIRRHNGQISHNIQGHVDDPNRQREISDAGYAALREIELPRGFSLGDESSVAFKQSREIKEMLTALSLSGVLVFLLMAVLFESLTLPFVVMCTTVPFAMAGALWTFYITGTPMDSVGWIGLIILIGVVVNNGIVLVDRIRRLHIDEGLNRRSAVLEGGASRVRPILMTAMTTVFGLLPMALSEPPAEGIDYRALATCIGGGLAFSTFFTLWVVPLAYTLVDDLLAAVSGRLEYTLQRLARRWA